MTAQLYLEDGEADEKELSDRREEIVKNQNLASKSKKFRLAEFINIGKADWTPSGLSPVGKKINGKNALRFLSYNINSLRFR